MPVGATRPLSKQSTGHPHPHAPRSLPKGWRNFFNLDFHGFRFIIKRRWDFTLTARPFHEKLYRLPVFTPFYKLQHKLVNMLGAVAP